jgi:hypothetical protein
VKENQGHLFEDIQYLLDVDVAHGYEREHRYSKTGTKGHGCMETRECWAIDREAYLSLICKREQWKGLKSIVRIVSQQQIGQKDEVQTRYFISSLPADAQATLKIKRSHWKIENQVHWVRDIAFREDESGFAKITALKIWLYYAIWS